MAGRKFHAKVSGPLFLVFWQPLSTISKVVRNELHYDETYAVPDRVHLQDYVEQLLNFKCAGLTNAEAGKALAKQTGRHKPFSETSVRAAIQAAVTERAEAWVRQTVCDSD